MDKNLQREIDSVYEQMAKCTDHYTEEYEFLMKSLRDLKKLQMEEKKLHVEIDEIRQRTANSKAESRKKVNTDDNPRKKIDPNTIITVAGTVGVGLLMAGIELKDVPIRSKLAGMLPKFKI